MSLERCNNCDTTIDTDFVLLEEHVCIGEQSHDIKTCSKCRKSKRTEAFYKRKRGKNELNSQCKNCIDLLNKPHKNSIKGLVTKIYSRQKNIMRTRWKKDMVYSKKELYNWMIDNGLRKLYNDWVCSGFQKSKVPSCDRIEDSKWYYFDNMRLVTFSENISKAWQKRKMGLDGVNKSVIKIDKKGNVVATYISIAQAARKTNIQRPNIIKCLNGERKTAGGFKWKYKNV